MSVPEGSLAVYSTDTDEQAHRLIVAACPMTARGEYFAEELAREQTIENLAAFSDRLHEVALRIDVHA